MNRRFSFVAGASLFLLLCCSITSSAQGPLDFSGHLNGAPFRIRVPANWNGTLLVFAHGYRDKADHVGEVDNRNADVAANAALEAPLLAQGYALAGSAYRDNGWAVEEAIQDLKDLSLPSRAWKGSVESTMVLCVGAELAPARRAFGTTVLQGISPMMSFLASPARGVQWETLEMTSILRLKSSQSYLAKWPTR